MTDVIVAGEWLLAIDFGTSFSSAAIFDLGGARVLEVGGARRVPSIVLVDEEGSILTGSSAAHQAGVFPDRVERTPKRYVGRRVMLLGGREVRVPEAVGAVLASFLAEAMRHRGGSSPKVVVLSHPARWEAERIEGLREAALAAGIADPVLVAEPVAAAAHYLHAAHQVSSGSEGRGAPEVGSRVAVYDLGGGTFDTAVLEARGGGEFVVVGEPGGDKDIGGESFDYRLFALVGHHLAAAAPEVWQQLRTSEERRWKRAAMDLMNQVRQAKETLSTETRTTIYVPEADRDVQITRAEFEELIADDIDRTVDLLEDTIEQAGFSAGDMDAIYLAGGSSRIPLVAQKMGERFGDKVQTWDDPKCVVAMGAAVGTGLGGGSSLSAQPAATQPAATQPAATLPVPPPEATQPVPPPAATQPVPPPAATQPVPPPAATQPVPPPAAATQSVPQTAATPPSATPPSATQPVPPPEKGRSKGPILAAVAVVVVLAVAIGAFVFLRGGDDGGGGAPLAESDISVDEATGLPPLGSFGEASVYTGGTVNAEYVLGGYTFDDEFVPQPAIWQSFDGLDWQQEEGEFENADGGVISGVLRYDDVVVAVGTALDPDDLTRSTFAAWYADDLGATSWNEADLPSSPNDQQVLGVIEFQGELLAYGLDGETDEESGLIQGDFALWRSADGREWSRAQDVAGIDLPDDLDEGLPFGELAQVGDRLIAVGRTGSGDDADPAVWISENGEEWDLTVSSSMAGLDGEQALDGIAEADGRIVAVGHDNDEAAVWTSEDGTDWQRVEDGALEEAGSQSMTSIFPVEGGVIAVGNDDPADDGDRQPAVWISDDLEQWDRLDLGDLSTDFSLGSFSPFGFTGLEEDASVVLVLDAEDFSGGAVWRIDVEPGSGSPDVLSDGDVAALSDEDLSQSQLVGFDALEEGSCYQVPDPDDEELRYEVVACDQPHDREMIHRFEFDDGPYPGEEALYAQGDEICQGEVFESYVGRPYLESEVFVEALVPGEEGWDLGDRAGACAAYLDGQQSEESFEGSGR